MSFLSDKTVVEVRDLTKKFEDLAAVDQVTFSIGEGEVFGLLGPNGAGKTTTLHILATLLKPTGGEAGGCFEGRWGPYRRRLSRNSLSGATITSRIRPK